LTTLWLKKKTSKELMSVFGKFKFKDSLERNILSRSNMDHCLAEKKSKGLMSIYGKFKVKDSGQKFVKLGQIWTSLAVKNIKGVNELGMESSNSKTFARNV